MGEATLSRRCTGFLDLVAGADDIGHVAIGETVGQLIEFFDRDALAFLGYFTFLAGASGAAVFIRRRGAAGRNQKCKANEDDAK